MTRTILPALAGLLLATMLAPAAGAAQGARLERVYLQLSGMG